jgi:murein DD-endopeptidase MepM/ murein hydrolase activator NlpD
MRELALGVVAAFAVAGCAVTNTPYPRPSAAATGAATPNIYTQAPRAPLQSELFACNGGSGSNLGELGARGESLRYTPYIYTPAGALLRNPTAIACLSSGFGWRGSASGGGRQHSGLDLANPDGGFIFAAGAGRIAYADWRGGYGLVVEIDHGGGVRTLYAHLSEVNPNLRPGDQVGEGEAIARMGMTGNATGVHLHYEVNVDGLLVDPLNYGVETPALF